MGIAIIIACITLLGVASIDGRLKKHLENDELIIDRLDILVNIPKDKGKIHYVPGKSVQNSITLGDLTIC